MRKGLSTVVFVGAVLLIVALLFPWYGGNTKESGKRTACLSNMKGLGLGILLYMGENDETLPCSRLAGHPSALGWAARIEPYLRPANPEGEDYQFRDFVEPGAVLSYAMNANVAELPKSTTHVRPEASVLLFEISGARRGRGGKLLSTLRVSPVGDGAAGGFVDSMDPNLEPVVRLATGPLVHSGLTAESRPRHGSRCNFLLLDGSAKYRPPENVVAGANAPLAKTPPGWTSCERVDLHGVPRPCADGARTIGGQLTFSPLE